MFLQIKTVNPVLKKAVSVTGVRGALLMLASYINPDVLVSGKNLSRIFLNAAQAPERYRAVHDLATAVHLIDDRVDTSMPDWILGLGEPEIGTVPCRLLSSPETCPPELTFAINKIVENGMASRDFMGASHNVLAHHLYQRAEYSRRFLEAPTAENRQNICEENLRITEFYMDFVTRILLGVLPPKDDNIRYRYEEFLEERKHLALGARIAQMVDDIRDFQIDMEIELEKGIPSANWLGTHVSRNGNLGYAYTDNSELSRYVCRQSKNALADKTPPTFYREAIASGKEEIYALAGKMTSRSARKIMEAFIGASIQEGIKSSAHPAVIAKQERLAQEYRALKIKSATFQV